MHWRPIKHCIHFKILQITYKALNGLAPRYLRKLLTNSSHCVVNIQAKQLVDLRLHCGMGLLKRELKMKVYV